MENDFGVHRTDNLGTDLGIARLRLLKDIILIMDGECRVDIELVDDGLELVSRENFGAKSAAKVGSLSAHHLSAPFFLWRLRMQEKSPRYMFEVLIDLQACLNANVFSPVRSGL